MPDVSETQLPGVGVRYEFTTSSGERVGVVTHRTGHREVIVYDADDPDACSTLLHLDTGDTRTMAELLGATRVSEVSAAVQQELEGLTIDWLRVGEGSPFVGRTIADGAIRTRTGASIVAVIRGTETIPAPGPDFEFAAGDVAVVVATVEGIDAVRAILVS